LIVLDASAALHLLLRTERGDWVDERVSGEDRRVPQLFEYEVVSALRREALGGELTAARQAAALANLASFRIRRYPPQPFLSRIWELRSSLTAYDASYVALAEALEAPLVTADARLARSHGHAAAIELVPA
jgi:predicted nucleic acid-binding protein